MIHGWEILYWADWVCTSLPLYVLIKFRLTACSFYFIFQTTNQFNPSHQAIVCPNPSHVHYCVLHKVHISNVITLFVPWHVYYLLLSSDSICAIIQQKQIVKEGQVLCYIEQLGGEIPIEVWVLTFIWLYVFLFVFSTIKTRVLGFLYFHPPAVFLFLL